MRHARAALRMTTLFTALLSAPAYAGGPQDAETVVRDTAAEVVRTINANHELFEAEPARLDEAIGALVLPHFDFERMSQRVLGKSWPRASEEQRRRFVREFETLLVRTYAAAMREHAARPLNFLPLRASGDGTLATVRTSMAIASGATLPINYEMYAGKDGWKVYDVSIDGVSLVINYRTSFAGEIRAGGLDGLIERLSRHNDGRSS